jgi:hypothetical protein
LYRRDAAQAEEVQRLVRKQRQRFLENGVVVKYF